MSKFLKLALLVLLLIAMASEAAGICKWTDENGVVHYAETCPEDSHSTLVPIEPPPSQQQIDATAETAEKLRSEISARHAQADREKDQEALQKRELEETSGANNRSCAEAWWNLGILQEQLPVYYDEDHQLHFNQSLHDYWYAGPRTYLDDQQRAAEILNYTMVTAQTCTGSEADSRGRARLYMEKIDGEICLDLRNKLENMKKLSTGIPSDEMRELEETIASRCR